MKAVVFGVLVFTFLLLNVVWAEDCPILNGSFEEPGDIDDISEQEPNHWDVNMPDGKFGGEVQGVFGVTDQNWSLTLRSERYVDLEVDDIVYVYQYVCLKDVNQITFDINLDTYPQMPWDPAYRTAVVMIDDEVVWESNSLGTDVRGQYRGVDDMCFVNINVGDFNERKFAVGLRVNVDENPSFRYFTDWDNIKCGLHCGGNGFLLGDFSRDCCVDFVDYAMFASVWKQIVDSNSIFNLSIEDDVGSSGIINFADLEVFLGDWLASSYD